MAMVMCIPCVDECCYRHMARQTREMSTLRTSARAWTMLETSLVVNLA